MAKSENVGDKYPGFNDPQSRMHFENPISAKVNTNPERYELVEYFNQTPGINADLASATEATRVPRNRDFEILGTNATSDDVTFAATIGGIECQTDGGSGDQVIVLPHLDTNQTAWTGIKWGTENQVIWEAIIRTAAITSVTIWAGLKLTNTEAVATDDDQAYFRFDSTDDTTWQAVYSIGGTDTSKDSGVTVAANTNYSLRIEIDSDRKAHFFIDDDEVASSTALTNDVDLIPYIGIQADTDAAKTLNIVKQKISRIIFE